MKRALLLAIAVCVALTCGFALAACATSTQGSAIPDSGTVDADTVLELDESVYLVDVRTPEEYAEGHIPGALNASYPHQTGGPCGAQEAQDAFMNAWDALEIEKDAHVVLYCRTGVRAASAASALEGAGYEHVSVYSGSWVDWTSDEVRPIEK